jgi:hypothetical protein
MLKYYLAIILFNLNLYGTFRNRINAEVDRSKRCVSTGLNAASCEKIRKKAVEINCINEAEYHTLKKYGAYPSCNILKGTGEDLLDGWCPCGCFHPATLIASYDTKDSRYKIKTAKNILNEQKTTQLVHLRKSSSIKKLSYKKSKIRITTEGKEDKKMLIIETKKYLPLILTEKHPIVISPGKMIAAKNLTTKHLLLNAKGQKVKITKISKKKYDLDVVNFSTERTDPLEHVIIANGLLTGDQYWQASLEDQFNRVFIRQQ